MHPYLFQSHALTSLKRCEAIFMQRGDEYADSWRECRFSTLKSLRDKFAIHGLHIPDCYLRMIALASMVDQKYSRQEGGYKDDSMLDGINYQLALAEEVREVEQFLELTIERMTNGTPDA